MVLLFRKAMLRQESRLTEEDAEKAVVAATKSNMTFFIKTLHDDPVDGPVEYIR